MTHPFWMNLSTGVAVYLKQPQKALHIQGKRTRHNPSKGEGTSARGRENDLDLLD